MKAAAGIDQKSGGNRKSGKDRTNTKSRVRRTLLLVVFSAALLAALIFCVRKRLSYSSAPEKSAGRNVTSWITVRTQAAGKQAEDQGARSSGLIQASLSMDEVPESYTYQPRHHGTIEKFWYTTNTYGLYGRKKKEIRKYAEVYLPYGYTSSKKYPIVYLMHGAGGSAERFFGSALNLKELKYVVDNMIELGEIEPMIFVGLTYYPEPGMGREDDWDAEYTKGFGQEFRNDVLPQVESHYSTFADSVDEEGLRASRWQRTFGGFSMGSVTTYYRLCDSLDVVHSFLGMSGSLYWGPDARESGSMADFGAQYIMNAVKSQGYTKDDFFLYSCAGSEDFALDVVNAQVRDEQNHPEFFSFGENGEPANVAFEIGQGEEHHGSHGTTRYLYNALPIFSDIMKGSSENAGAGGTA